MRGELVAYLTAFIVALILVLREFQAVLVFNSRHYSSLDLINENSQLFLAKNAFLEGSGHILQRRGE